MSTCLIVINVIKRLRPGSRYGNIVNENMQTLKNLEVDWNSRNLLSVSTVNENDLIQCKKQCQDNPKEVPSRKSFGVKRILDMILKPSKDGSLYSLDEKIDESISSDDERETDASDTEYSYNELVC